MYLSFVDIDIINTGTLNQIPEILFAAHLCEVSQERKTLI